jgi:dihydroorotase (multifunctional complex type)
MNRHEETPMQEDVTFTDCRIWMEGRFEPGKLTISGSRIEALGDFAGIRGREISCEGLAVLPAFIDNHVHFREPGAEEKEDFRSGSAASAHGGVGMVLEVQNSPPLLTTPELAHAKRRIAAEKSLVRVGLYASATPQILPHIREMAELTSGLKLFMAPSHGDEGLGSEDTMRPFFQKASEIGYHLIVHAEDGRIISSALKKYGDKGPAYFSRARPPSAEIASVEMALRLAGEYGTRLHVFHVTTAGAVDLVTDARQRGVDVTCSTCPHYLFFTDADLPEMGGLLKVNPSIKGAHDRQRLLEGIRGDEVQIVSTDHAPHKPAEKALPFKRVPAGISSADLVLPLMTTLVARGELSFEDVVRLCISNPAAIHGLLQGGSLKEGDAADLVLFYPEEEWVVTGEDFLSRANASPYVGMSLTGRVAATLVDGQRVFLDSNGPLAGLV